jgi:acyl-CoA reductase-like NAD-dependent aldehyde dehydrogenase
MADLGKPEMEAYGSEIAPVYAEIKWFLKNLSRLQKPKPVATPLLGLAHWGGRSWIERRPLGRVLILAPWNYPIYLSLIPVVGALAAGNEVCLKPSEMAPACSKVMAKILKNFPGLTVEEGGVETSQRLLQEDWGHVLFTGSTSVGRQVAATLASRLIPCTLELGGKSPAIFDQDTHWETSVRRLWWGKIYNCGQTCVAPDYVLVPEDKLQHFIDLSQTTLKEFFGHSALKSKDYGRIVNEKHFHRLMELMKHQEVLMGGGSSFEDLKIEPTLIAKPSMNSALMLEEIFGPLLPVLTYKKEEDVISIVKNQPYPLALMIFSNSRSFQQRMLDKIPSGGACLNDCLIHLSNPHLPFGGIRTSGIGAYHGEKSYETFTHARSIERKPLWLDSALRYPPYRLKLRKWVKWFI